MLTLTSDCEGEAMFELHKEDRKLIVRVDKANTEARMELQFERTARVPDDGRTHEPPPGLGPFPLAHLTDFEHSLPPEWGDRGGVIMPVRPSEAMWIAFAQRGYPCAIKIGAGAFNAVNGEPWTEELKETEGDYIVAPPQAWLDGFYIGNNRVRQFVAKSAGPAEEGGLCIVVYPMKLKHYRRLLLKRRVLAFGWLRHLVSGSSGQQEFILGLGGRVKESIYADPYGFDAWNLDARARCVVTLIDPDEWFKLTGTPPDPSTT
jgi:hypothetical protein